MAWLRPPGVLWWCSCRWERRGLADPAGVVVAVERAALCGAFVGAERGGRGPDEPGVDGEPVPVGGLFDPLLELLGQPQVDPGDGTVVGLGRRRGRGLGFRLGR